MSDYRMQIVKHNDVVCLHVMIDGAEQFDGFVQTYIPLDDIIESATKQGYAMYNLSDAMLQKVCESQGYSKPSLSDIERLEALEAHFTTQGLNDLTRAIEQRIVSRMRYGRNPQIEVSR